MSKRTRSRRQFDKAEMVRIADEALAAGNIHATAVKHDLAYSVLKRWIEWRQKGKLRDIASSTAVVVAKPTPQQLSGAKRYNDAFRAKVIAARRDGMPHAEIKERFGVPSPTVKYWMDKADGKPVGYRKKDHVEVIPLKAMQVQTIGGGAQANREAIIFLKQMERELVGGIRAGRFSSFENHSLLGLLALNKLTRA